MQLFSKKQNQLTTHFSPKGIHILYDGKKSPLFPLNKNEPSVLATLLHESGKWVVLESLWEEELLSTINENSWLISYDLYGKLNSLEDGEVLSLLNLPVPEPLDIELKTNTHVGDNDFKISAHINHPELGQLRENDFLRFGQVLYINKDRIIPMTVEQADLYDTLQIQDAPCNVEDRMSYLAKTKLSAAKANAKIDPYLNSENYDFRSEVGLDLREDESGELTLIPEFKNIDLSEFGIENGENLISDNPPAILTKLGSKNNRDRLVVDKQIRENLTKLPRNGKITGQDIPRLLTNPEQIIPEGFDLSLFSERVKGIKTKVYNSRPYIHVNKTSGGWFEGVPGIELVDWSPVNPDAKDTPEEKPQLSQDTINELVRKAKISGDEFIQAPTGEWIKIDQSPFNDISEAIKPFDIKEDGTIIIPAGSILDIIGNVDVLGYIADETAEAMALPDDLPQISPPTSLNAKLHPHQLIGYRWLNRLSLNSIGGLLADDMGLGKTIQVITHMLNLKATQGDSGTHLIILPKTLIDNWIREIVKFSNNSLKVYCFDGPNRIFTNDFFDSFDVVLTTYDTLRRDQAKLATVNWNMVVCDEAQYAKNPTTQRSCAVKALKARHRIALSGTPVENGLIEFWCIMDFVQPGLLKSWSEFRKNYERPIVNGLEEERTEHVNNLLTEIKGYYLRRLKTDILKDLPGKEIIIRKTVFGKTQFQMYQEIARKGKAGGGKATLGAIQQLIMVSAHPATMVGSIEDSLKLSCPKLDATMKIISEVKDASEKIIIFSDFKIIQRVLQKSIQNHFGIWPDIINGEMNVNRQHVIDIFSEKNGFNVIILGHQVAGIGLNITAANHVIHYTRPWNPAKENQATDRVHRIGQTKPVNVYYPLVAHDEFKSVEMKLDELLKSKEDLARDVLRPSSEMNVKKEDLFECFDL